MNKVLEAIDSGDYTQEAINRAWIKLKDVDNEYINVQKDIEKM